MKLPIHSSLIILAIVPALFAAPPDLQNSARTYIPDPLQAPIFVPPVPVERKPLPNIRIDATTILSTKSGKILTLQRGAASTLPDLPPPPPPKPAQPAKESTPEELAQQLYQRRHSIRLGATIYNHKVSDVHWTDQETGVRFQAICGFDIGLIAGLGRFVHDGEIYSLDLNPGDIDFNEVGPRANVPPEIRQISVSQIVITQGDSKASDATAGLYFIKDLIDSEMDRLITYQAARKQYQRDAGAWAKAHPPIPRDETFIFRPHRGSRYLANPQPEKKGETTR